MCGIVGYSIKDRSQIPTAEKFIKIIQSLAHRGPDDEGRFQTEGVGLGHRRLSIIDLSSFAHQPMSSDENAAWITYNGEIYNFQELRKELEELGYRFKTSSDTEVLLKAYLHWDIDCLKRLNGIFAFCIYDKRKDLLFLARDPLGVKPLFYSQYNNDFYFASEVPALLKFETIPTHPDYQALDTYFTFGYTPAPMTGFKHIRQLMPGHYMVVNKDKVYTAQYWDVNLDEKNDFSSEQEAVEVTDALFQSVVKRQMVSDVSLGVFLSAGTDSFAVARAMKQSEVDDIQAFSIGFNKREMDELEYTYEAAKALGVNLQTQRMDSTFDDLLLEVAGHCQEPFADSSCLPVYQLCQMTAEKVKVALSGDGADELLGGYETYTANRYAKTFRKIPSFIQNGLLKPLANFAPDKGAKYTLKEKVHRFVKGASLGPWRDHASWRVIIPQEWKESLYTTEFFNAVKDFDPLDLYVDYITHAKTMGCSDLDAYLYADLKFYLPNDMLVKVDRMSMAHGLEVRVPFLDIEMVDFCFKLPEDLKINKGKGKYILRKMIEDKYPSKLNQRPKSGFNVRMDPFLDQNYPENRFINNKTIHETMLQSHSRYSHFLAEYNLFMFQQTMNNFQELEEV